MSPVKTWREWDSVTLEITRTSGRGEENLFKEYRNLLGDVLKFKS